MAENSYAGNSPLEEVISFTAGDTVASDTVDSGPYKGFHANVAGTVKFNDGAGNATTKVVNAGTYYPYRVTRLWATGHNTLNTASIGLAR